MATKIIHIGGPGPTPAHNGKDGIPISMLLANLDADGDGRIDKKEQEMAQILKRMDKDGDGKVSVQELMHIGEQAARQSRTIKNLRMVIFGVILLSFVFCGLMLGLMIAANEASKDSRPDKDGVLETTDGKMLGVQGIKSETPLALLPTLPLVELRGLDELVIPMSNGAVQLFQVSGFKWFNATAMTIFTVSGHTIVFDDSTISVFDVSGEPEDGHPPTRSLLSIDTLMEFRAYTKPLALIKPNGANVNVVSLNERTNEQQQLQSQIGKDMTDVIAKIIDKERKAPVKKQQEEEDEETKRRREEEARAEAKATQQALGVQFPIRN